MQPLTKFFQERAMASMGMLCCIMSLTVSYTLHETVWVSRVLPPPLYYLILLNLRILRRFLEGLHEITKLATVPKTAFSTLRKYRIDGAHTHPFSPLNLRGSWTNYPISVRLSLYKWFHAMAHGTQLKGKAKSIVPWLIDSRKTPQSWWETRLSSKNTIILWARILLFPLVNNSWSTREFGFTSDTRTWLRTHAFYTIHKLGPRDGIREKRLSKAYSSPKDRIQAQKVDEPLQRLVLSSSTLRILIIPWTTIPVQSLKRWRNPFNEMLSTHTRRHLCHQSKIDSKASCLLWASPTTTWSNWWSFALSTSSLQLQMQERTPQFAIFSPSLTGLSSTASNRWASIKRLGIETHLVQPKVSVSQWACCPS